MPLPPITPSPYYPNNPQATDDPSDSQALLLSNAGSTNEQFGYDHVALTAGSDNGFHKSVSFPNNNPPDVPGGLNAPSAFQSIAFTNPGTADAASSQLFWQNANTRYLLSCVKAWGTFDGTLPVGVIAFTQGHNVTMIERLAVDGRYKVTLAANAVSSAEFGVVVSGQMSDSFTVGSTLGINQRAFAAGVGSFQINSRSLTAASGALVTPITFVVLQI